MAYKNPKDRPKQVNKPVGSKPFKARMERQRARRAVDRTGTDANKNGKADKREGRDVSHTKAFVRRKSWSYVSNTADHSSATLMAPYVFTHFIQ